MARERDWLRQVRNSVVACGGMMACFSWMERRRSRGHASRRAGSLEPWARGRDSVLARRTLPRLGERFGRSKSRAGASNGLACFVLAVAVTMQPFAAWAHALLVRSEPKDKQALSTPPKVVRLWFNELLDRGLHAVEVFPASDLKAKKRKSLTAGPPAVNPDDRTELRVELAPLPPGKYVVEYRVLSRDGHSAPGRITFEVLPPN